MKYPVKERKPEDLKRVFDLGRCGGYEDANEHYPAIVYGFEDLMSLAKAEGWNLISQHHNDEEPFTDDARSFVAQYQAGYVWQYSRQFKSRQEDDILQA